MTKQPLEVVGYRLIVIGTYRYATKFEDRQRDVDQLMTESR